MEMNTDGSPDSNDTKDSSNGRANADRDGRDPPPTSARQHQDVGRLAAVGRVPVPRRTSGPGRAYDGRPPQPAIERRFHSTPSCRRRVAGGALTRLLVALTTVLAGCSNGTEPVEYGIVEGVIEAYYFDNRHLFWPDRNIVVSISPELRTEVSTGGRYRFDRVPAGIYDIVALPDEDVPTELQIIGRPTPVNCQPLGFRDRKVGVSVDGGTVTPVDFHLDASHLNGRCFTFYRND